MPRLDGFGDNLNVAIFGASGGIGTALVRKFSRTDNVANVFAISRQKLTDQDGVKAVSCPGYSDEILSEIALELPNLHIVICALGLLHGGGLAPEKSSSQITIENMREVFEVNTFAPALIAKHMLPKLVRQQKNVFAALSARVGSISDNRLGGWYSYRASKAALNMTLKTLAIEQARKRKKSIVIGLHPGTVDTQLSEPFQKNVREDKLFSPDFSATKLMDVISKVEPEDSGKIFAWDGQEILP